MRFRLEYMRYHRGYCVPIAKFLKIIDTANASSGTILTLKGQIPWKTMYPLVFLSSWHFSFLGGILSSFFLLGPIYLLSRYISADQTIKERSFWRTSFYEHLKAKCCLSRVTYFVKEKNIDALLTEAKWFFFSTQLVWRLKKRLLIHGEKKNGDDLWASLGRIELSCCC